MATDNKTTPPQTEEPTADLEVLLPSSEPGEKPCPVYFDQLCAELADIFDVHIDREKFKGAPLTAEQRRAIAYAAPEIRDQSKKITALLQARDARQICKLDWELDDVKVAEELIDRQIEAVSSGACVVDTIFSAVERTGTAAATWPDENVDTLNEGKKLFTARLGYEPEYVSDDGKTYRWSKHKVTLVQGPNLRQTRNTQWLKDRTWEGPSERTLSAAARLAEQLPGAEPFDLLLFTSAVGWGALSEEVKDRCRSCVMTNRIFLNKGREVELAANGGFDMNAVTALARDLVGREIPLIDLHGSWLARKSQTFGQRDRWDRVLDASVPNHEPYRRAIDLNMSLISRWGRQYQADTLGMYEDEYMKTILAPDIRRLIGGDPELGTELTKAERAAAVQMFPWIADTLNPDHYTKEHASASRANRGQAIVDSTRNFCNASLADLTALLKHSVFLPCHVDYETLGRREKVTSISLDFENPSTFIAILGDERAFDEVFDKVLRNTLQEDTNAVSSTSTKRTPIIDETVARETKKWMEWQKMTASELDESLRSMTNPEQKDIDLAKGVLSACESGPMIKKARSVLYGSTEGAS